MIEHLKIAVLLITLTLGTAITIYTINLKNQFKDKSLKWLVVYYISFNLTMLLTLTRKYLQINLFSGINYGLPVFEISKGIITLFLLLMLTGILGITFSLLGKETNRLLKYISIPSFSFLLILWFFKYIIPGSSGMISFVDYLFSLAALIIDVTAILCLLFLIGISSKMTDINKRKLNVSLGYFIGIPVLLNFLINIFLLNNTLPINRNTYSIIVLVVFALQNIFPFIWLVTFYKSFQLALISSTIGKSNTVNLKEYSISGREEEIINLILAGKANKEIEEMLFISPHTVKNHIYHIYQKLGIKSRFQLISLLNNRDNSK